MTNHALTADLRGTGVPIDDPECDVNMVEHGEGFCTVAVTFEISIVEFEVEFKIEQAEEFIVEFRDELNHAKQNKLEWETNTDPKTGVAEDGS